MAAAGVQKKSMDTPDETRDFEQGLLQTATIRDFKVARATLQPGWKWSEHIKPIVQTDSCQVRHTGYVVSGQMKIVMDDRAEMDLGPGDAYVIEPGHDAWVVGSEPFVGPLTTDSRNSYTAQLLAVIGLLVTFDEGLAAIEVGCLYSLNCR